MKAIQISKYGEADELKMQETETPSPKAGEILVRIHDAGVNPYDWKVRKGFMKDIMPVQFPLTMGYDFAGVIEKVGANVQDYRVGERVFGFTQGAYAEFAICSPDKIAKIPDVLSFDVAASLPTPGLTAYQLIADHVRPTGAQTVLIHGAAGAVGSIAVQVAKSFGMRVFANAAQNDEDYLKQIGVEKIIDYKSQRFEEFFKDLDAVVDLVGGETLNRSYQCVKKDGLVITTVGPVRADLAKQAEVNAKFFLTNQNSKGLSDLAKLVAVGKIKPRLAEVMPLENAAEAQKLNEQGKSHGKIVLRVH